MKLFEIILKYAGLLISTLVALVFAFLEFRTLFAGDVSLANVPWMSAIQYLCRGLYFLTIIALCVFILLFNINKKNICIILFAGAVALLIGAFLSFLFYHWFVALAIVAINAITTTITAIGFFKPNPEYHS